MIDAEQIKMMKPTVRLINCARGGIINEDALYNALAEKRIAGAALDVFSKEPPENTRFAEFENCLVTPHLAQAQRKLRSRWQSKPPKSSSMQSRAAQSEMQ